MQTGERFKCGLYVDGVLHYEDYPNFRWELLLQYWKPQGRIWVKDYFDIEPFPTKELALNRIKELRTEALLLHS